MPLEQVETPKTREEEEQANKPLLNIQLPSETDPNVSLTVGKHNASAMHNFEQVGNVLMTIINNQKMIGMIIQNIQDKQFDTEKSIASVLESIKKLLGEKENDEHRTNITAK
jgi:hypothetical protein